MSHFFLLCLCVLFVACQSAPKAPPSGVEIKPIVIEPIEDSVLAEKRLDPTFNQYYLYSDDKDSAEFKLLKRRALFRYLTPTKLGLNDNNVSALLVNNDDVWIGTWQGGILRYSLPLKTATVFDAGEPSLQLRNIVSIDLYKDEIWVTAYDKIHIYNKKQNKWRYIYYHNKAPASFLTKPVFVGDQIFWGTSRNGMLEYKAEKWKSLPLKNNSREILHAIYLDKDYGLLLGGYRQGLLNQDADFNKLQKQLPKANINAMASNDKRIYFATNNAGLWFFDKKKHSASSYNEKSTGLNLTNISTLYLGEDYLFVGTNQSGLFVQNLKTKKWITIGIEEGLIGLDISSLILKGSTLIIGSLGQGVTILDWDSYVESL